MARICARCGKVVPGTVCPFCGAGKSGYRRTREQEQARKGANPWRSHYSSAEYKANSQSAIRATSGRCRVCGRQIARYVSGRWKMIGGVGGIHHIKALSEGGTDAISNLVPLCAACHNRVDSERRRANGR